mmetsp:Transcript_2121/g.2995  ORF Transcript_2121/g.2995 Transcript_2121/m.2995 type:complete len:219 (+) Transcript_2121:489-1145(+)
MVLVTPVHTAERRHRNLARLLVLLRPMGRHRNTVLLKQVRMAEGKHRNLVRILPVKLAPMGRHHNLVLLKQIHMDKHRNLGVLKQVLMGRQVRMDKLLILAEQRRVQQEQWAKPIHMVKHRSTAKQMHMDRLDRRVRMDKHLLLVMLIRGVLQWAALQWVVLQQAVQWAVLQQAEQWVAQFHMDNLPLHTVKLLLMVQHLHMGKLLAQAEEVSWASLD